MNQTFKKILWKGLLWSIPFVLTVWLAGLVFRIADSVLGPFTRALVRAFVPESLLVGPFAGGQIPGLSLIFMVVLLASVGSFISLRWGKTIAEYMEHLIQRVPGIGAIFRNARKISTFFETAETAKFEGVVLVPYPYPDVLTIAFVTGKIEIIDENGTSKTYLKTVIPNPPTGIQALPLVPEHLAMQTGLTIEEGIQIYISMSMAAPKELIIR